MAIRTVDAAEITAAIEQMCVSANCRLPEVNLRRLEEAAALEKSPLGRSILARLLQNHRLAGEQMVPACQDTGLAVVFAEIGQDVHISGGAFESAVDEGVRRGYTKGYLRKSSVSDPLFDRRNTGDNTPAILHVRVVPGDKVRLTLAPKGGGAENMSAVRMLTPSEGVEGVISFAVEAVSKAGPSACPPVVVGIGIGGTFDMVTVLAKAALLRPMGDRNPDPRYAELEQSILARVNGLGIGPQGFGGSTTALAVHIEARPCHIASLPVAVNLNCHVSPHETRLI